MVFIISVLDLGTEKHMRLLRGCSCLSCPRFSNLEALPLPGAPTVLVAAQTQQHPENWAGGHSNSPPWGAATWDGDIPS